MTRSAPRTTLRLLLALGLAASVLTVLAPVRDAAAQSDPRAEAKTSYEQGKKMYAAGDYRGAISAFSRAEALSPSPYNDFNIALCYDKLGEADIAVKYYRSYLAKAPDAPNKATVEASIARLDAAAKAAEAKAEEARKAEDAKRAEEARKAEDARRAEDAARAEDARRAEDAARANPTPGPTGPAPGPTGPATGVVTGPATGVATAPTTAPSTGDPELDKVQGIDINAIRNQRGFDAGGTAPTGPATAAGTGAIDGNGMVATTTADPNAGPAPDPTTTNTAQQPVPEQPKPHKPIYKQWWFWVVVGVSAYVLISIAAADDPNNNARTQLDGAKLDDRSGAQDVERRWTALPDMGRNAMNSAGGATLLRW